MATARPRPQVMRLTDAAALRIKDVMARAEKPVAGVRVGVKNGGCAGMEYRSKKTAEPVPLLEGTEPNPPIEGTIDMGGGIPIIVDKDTIGAIAVSGGPNWDEDEACAKAGLAKVADKLK